MNDAVPPPGSLEAQRRAFAARRFLAMPLAGLIAWSIAGLAGASLPPFPAVVVFFVATGSIVYIGAFVGRYTGETILGRRGVRNAFDSLFLHAVVMALLVYGIAIPFFLVDYTSLPLTVGILTGLMWAPISWMIGHWIGLAHAIARTAGVVAAWYLWPDLRFVAVPVVIVLVYLFSIAVLERRWMQLQEAGGFADAELADAGGAE